MLIVVDRLNYDASYTYAPPREEAVINTAEIVSAVPTEARGPGPFLLIKFRDGSSMTIVGTADTLLPGTQKPAGRTNRREYL